MHSPTSASAWTRRGFHRRARAFTLLELIVVILVLGVLAAVAVIGYSSFTDKAHDSAAQVNLENAARSVLAQATLEQRPINRTLALEALSASFGSPVVDGISAAPWRLGRAGQAPVGQSDFALAFDNGEGTLASDTAGSRAVLVTLSGSGTIFAQMLTVDGTGGDPVEAPAGVTTPGQYLDEVAGGATPGPLPVFRTTWDTEAPACAAVSGQEVRLGIEGVSAGGSIDWGDGTVEALREHPRHTYAAPGVKEVTVSGSFTRFTAQGPSVNCLTAVTEWGETGTTDVTYAFFGSANLVSAAQPPPTATSYEGLFYQATGFNQDISSWDMSHVTNASRMFLNASSFNQPVGSWDMSGVTNMRSMLAGATKFNQPLAAWDTSAVTDMSGMFAVSPAFNQSLASWDTSAVTTMATMFVGAHAFNQPLAAWDTHAVTDMSHMFRSAYAFNQPLDAWDTGAVTTMAAMFHMASSFNRPLASWDTSAVTTMTDMFHAASSFNQDLSSWVTGSVVYREYFAHNAYSWTAPKPVFN